MTTFLDFERPIAELTEQLDKMKQTASTGEVDMKKSIAQLEKQIESNKKKLYKNLTGWQRVQISRHPERPYTLDYIDMIFEDFVELHGDRNVKDDKAIVGGLGKIGDQSFMVIGHQKGRNTKQRQFRNFGMANPEGYKKALRLMQTAERFNLPVICFIDTPGAYPGLEAEERGQAEAIAKNLFEMAQLETPIVCIVIGEGASGGALGIGVGDKIYMLENTWYSVISPESCSSILWRSWDFKEQAAEALKLTSEDMKGFGLVDDIIPEPLGGAHNNPEQVAEAIKETILTDTTTLLKLNSDALVRQRIDKFSAMGQVKERKAKKIALKKK